MRVVAAAAELEAALGAARREAGAAFGDERVLAERYLERPRHIEVQVLGDAHGNLVHLGERECSLQRRHQKVVEEAPSPVVDERTREAMGAAALDLCRACGYRGAGTVEMIAPAGGGEFFFLEMNTRLQVEHPVTELVWGVDLVEQQLRVAAGQPLAFGQSGLRPAGHAVEARIYAEDPAAGFLPATGTVHRYREPSGPGVRVDSGIRSGSRVGTEFDPMLVKVIAHGPDRGIAFGRLERALGELELLGVPTNAAFSRELIGRADVLAGEQDTGLLERVLGDLPLEPPADLPAAAAVVGWLADTAGLGVPPGPWHRDFEDTGFVAIDGETLTIGGREHRFAAREIDSGHALVSLDGTARVYAFARDDDSVWVGRDGHAFEARVERLLPGGEAAATGSLEAPMPGTVLAVHAANGDAVEEGQVLVVLESMKMELQVTAPHAGEVAALEVAVGDRVEPRQTLLAVTPAGEQRPDEEKENG
jgi:acetyl-CoA/propionyl-CoA carboxylase biotin carboxyl carrier protein